MNRRPARRPIVVDGKRVRRSGKPRPKGYVCEWSCGKAFRDGADYIGHVEAKHDHGAEPLPKGAR